MLKTLTAVYLAEMLWEELIVRAHTSAKIKMNLIVILSNILNFQYLEKMSGKNVWKLSTTVQIDRWRF